MKFKVILPELNIQEKIYEVEAESEEEAIEKIKNDEVTGRVIATFSNYDGSDNRIWDDVEIYPASYLKVEAE